MNTVKSNEDGYVLIVTVLLLLMLTIIGIAATHTAIIELQISGNNRRMVEDFYVAEGALITVLENSDWWLDDVLAENGAASAYWLGNVDIDGDDANDASIEIRCVERHKSDIVVPKLGVINIPSDRHIAPPPINSGYSVRYFTIRKFAATATDLRSGISLQSGVWKIFSKLE